MPQQGGSAPERQAKGVRHHVARLDPRAVEPLVWEPRGPADVGPHSIVGDPPGSERYLLREGSPTTALNAADLACAGRTAQASDLLTPATVARGLPRRSTAQAASTALTAVMRRGVHAARPLAITGTTKHGGKVHHYAGQSRHPRPKLEGKTPHASQKIRQSSRSRDEAQD